MSQLKAARYPVELGCDLVGLSRSSYYYLAHPHQDPQLEEALQELAGQFPTYGGRRLTQQLRRAPYQWVVNHKHIQRLLRQEGLLQPLQRAKTRTTDSQHPYPRYPNRVKDLAIDHPEQVWVADITYIRLGQEFVYLAMLMDVFTRLIRGWQLSQSLDEGLTLGAVRRALAGHCPQIHHSDQGIQYANRTYIRLLKQHQVQISMAAPGKAEENGYAERWIRTLKEEEVALSDYHSFAEARQQIGHFIDEVYRTKRIHSSLGYLTPAEFETRYQNETARRGTPNNP